MKKNRKIKVSCCLPKEEAYPQMPYLLINAHVKRVDYDEKLEIRKN
jgi:hypothetical protein